MVVNVCRICLRTDKNLKAINSSLSEYHDEITDYNIDTVDPLFCTECEHQLRKHYNFRNKCVRAARIFQKWEKHIISQEASSFSTPVESLYKMLPSSTQLGLSTADTAKVLVCVHEETDEPKPTLFIHEGLIVNNKDGDDQPKRKATTRKSIRDRVTKPPQRKKIVNKTTEELKTEQINEKDDKNGVGDIKLDDDFAPELDDSHMDIDNNHIDDDIDDDDDKALSELKHEPPLSSDHNYVVKKEGMTRKRSLDDSESKDSTRGNVKRKRIKNVKEKSNRTNKVPKKNSDNDQSEKYLIVHGRKERESTTKTIVKRNMEKEQQTFDAEKLKAELTIKFASCGELTASDGTVIDKDYMMDCLYRKMKEPTMELLWSRIWGRKSFTPKTIKMLAFLQNRYRRLDKYEDVFQIEYFNTMDKVREEFENRKNYPAFLSADFKCLICYQKFISEKCLERHARWHKESSGAFVCEVCGYRYPTEERLKHHFACYHQAVFKCRQCSYVTYNSENMDGHYSKHRNLKATCAECNKTLANKAMLKFHIRVKHSGVTPKQHICTLCGRALCDQWYRRHLMKHHGVTVDAIPPIEGPGVPCEPCDVTFPSDEVYQSHLRYVHQDKTKPRIRKKRSANKPKTTASSTNSPKKPTRSGRPLGLNGEWTCRVCSAVGRTWGKLVIHFEFDHPDMDMNSIYADTTQTLCEICGKGLSNVYSLRDHMRIHTGDRPFACDMCPKTFTRAIGLQGHRLTHFPKTKPCPYCGKLFRQTGNLLNHVRIHVNDRRYKCKVCGKGFLHRQALKEHFNGVHLHVRRVKRPAGKKGAELDRNQIIEEEIIYTGSSEYE